MRCAFSAGAMKSLALEHNFIDPPIIVAASGDTGTSLYFATRQYDKMRPIWTEHLASRKFIARSRLWQIMNIDYLIDKIFSELDPWEGDKLADYPGIISIPLLNYESKQIEFHQPTNTTLPPLEILRAAKALPIVYGKRVDLGGTPYLDGGLATSIPDMIKEAQSHGATHFIILNTQVRLGLYLFLKKLIKPIFSNHEADADINVDPDNIIEFRLERRNFWFLTRSKKRLTEMYELGYEMIQTSANLKAFLS